MQVRDDFTDTVGNTPLIKLRKASELTGCTILGKAEFLNPGGSVKDRAAKYIILDAEARRAYQARLAEIGAELAKRAGAPPRDGALVGDPDDERFLALQNGAGNVDCYGVSF